MLLFIITNSTYFGQIIRYIFNKTQFTYYFQRFRTFLNKFRIMDLITKSSSTLTSTIIFSPDEKQHCCEINGRNVTVIGGTGKHDHGSSKVKLKNIVDYKWEQKNYPGRLIAVHNEGKFIAYAIKVNNRAKTEGMVRVVHLGLGQRALIKGMSNEVLDLQYAHLSKAVMLAIIEETALHVHKVETISDKVVCTFLLKIDDPLTGHIPKYDKIRWCPYMPENLDEIDDYASQLLVWTRGNTFQCYSVSTVIRNYGMGDRKGSAIEEGCLKFKENIPAITGATFSADGTTLAISSEDGVIRFYQVYLHTNETNPRCLHQWKPHGGKTITSFFFLDNHSNYGVDQTLWKHAVTCSENNTEIKVWSCETWECTQTIIFKPSNDVPLSFKAEIDMTSAYIVLSDMNNRELYVLQVRKENLPLNTILNGKLGSDESTSMLVNDMSSENSRVIVSTSKAYINSIAQFPLSSSILSFGILDAAVRKYKCGMSDAYLIDELEDYDEENNALYCVVIHMFLVQPKSVQECHVLYQPSILGSTTDIRSTLSAGSSEFKDLSISSISSSTKSNDLKEEIKLNILEPPVAPVASIVVPESPTVINEPITLKSSITSPANSIPKHSSQINLMTPDSFNSPAERANKPTNDETVSQEVLSTLFMLAKATTKPGTSPNLQNKALENMSVLNFVKNTIIEEEQQKIRESAELQKALLETPPVPPMPSAEMLASGGSSPSREVQEILSLKDTDCLNDFYDSDNILLDETDGIGNDDDELNELENEIIDDETFNFKNIAIAIAGVDDGVKPINKSNDIGFVKTEEKNKKADWPKVPDVPIMSKHSAELNAANSLIAPHLLMSKMDKIIDIIQSQTCQISDLRNQVYELQKVRNEESAKTQTIVTKMESNLRKSVEESLVRHERKHNQNLETLISITEKQNHALRESMVQNIPQMLYQQIAERFSSHFLGEWQRLIMPMIVSKIDMMKQHIQMDVAQKLTATDAIFKENIEKMCRNQAIVEAFSNSVMNGVKKSLDNTYSETLKSTILPGYEKISQELFKQLHHTFYQGTKDYTNKLDMYMSQCKMADDRSTEVVGLLKAMPEQINTQTEKCFKQNTSQIIQDINKDFKLVQSNIIKTVKDNIRSEIEKGFETQASSLEDSVLLAVRSQAQTPAPTNFDIQEQIKQFLAQGNINKAFHKALLSNDLSLVEFTLEKADYKTVFNPCPLEQTVLLSLIQQISADMATHNEMKHRYLSDAIVSLNFLDPITKEHAPKVMSELNHHCQNYLSNNESNSLNTNIKLLMIAIQGLGFKQF